MKQAKTFTAILLTGALLAGSLSGCGNNKNASTVSTTTSAAAGTTTAATTSPTTTTVTPVTALRRDHYPFRNQRQCFRLRRGH